jgi:exopolysaccharide biosynthesis polyprenyl glycosylphosphotransferase
MMDANARYILVMNPDVIVLSGAIERMMNYMDAHPDVGACGPKTLYPDGSLQATCRRFPHWGTVLWRWLKLDRLIEPEFYRRFLMSNGDHDKAQAVDWVMGSCMMIRNEAFMAAEGFDEEFFLYYEDIDFCRRLWQTGYRVHYVPDAVVVHTYQRHSGRNWLNPLTLVHLKSIFHYRDKHGLGWGEIVGKRSITNLVLLLMLGDLVITEFALQLGRYARLWFPILGAYPYPNPSPLNKIIYVVVPVIWLVVFSLIGLYHPDQVMRAAQDTGRLLFGVMLSGLILAGSLYALFLYQVYIPRLLLAYFLLFDVVLLIAERALLHYVLSRNGLIYRPRALIVGTEAVGQQLAEWLSSDRQARVDLIGTIPWLNDGRDGQMVASTFTQAMRVAEVVEQLQVDEVILTPPLPFRNIVGQIVKALQKLPIDVKVVPDFLDLALHQAQIEDMYGVLVVSLRSSAIRGGRRVAKRVFDLAISIPVALVSLPVMFLAAIAISIDSPGPVIFRQRRIGENGRLFTIYKFRSMTADAEKRFSEIVTVDEQGQLIHKTLQDPRVTRVGRFLRRWSLDELPQLWNVIKGEMSLVGPRPELPVLVAQYESWQYKRLAVPPGLTGWWQIRCREKPMHLATEEDLFYVEHFSILLDLQILISSIWVVLSGRGAF